MKYGKDYEKALMKLSKETLASMICKLQEKADAYDTFKDMIKSMCKEDEDY